MGIRCCMHEEVGRAMVWVHSIRGNQKGRDESGIMATEDHCCMDDGEKASRMHYVCAWVSNRKGGVREKGLYGRAAENGRIGGSACDDVDS